MRTSKQRKMLFIVVVLILAGGALLWFAQRLSGFDTAISPTPSPATEIDVDYEIPADWKTYSSPSLGFGLKYDPSLQMEEDAEGVRWYKWGPTQSEGTEVYDGMIVSFHRTEFTGSLDDYINQQLDNFRDVGEITKPLHSVRFNGIEGQSFSGSSLGDYTISFIRVNEGEVIVVSSMAPDPGNRGFQKTIDTMLSTLELVK